MKKKKIIALFIAYNASKTLKKFYQEFPKHLFDEIILVDDASKDDTFRVAKKLGINSFKNPVNLGYGGNLKRAMQLGLQYKGDIFVDIHPDGEYQTSTIPQAIKLMQGGADLVLGNRFTSFSGPVKNGMYFWKLFPLKFLNVIDNMVLGINISDFHQGFRLYSRKLLETINFNENSNSYLFSFELITQAAFHKAKIDQVPVETNYKGKKRGASLKSSIIYSLGTFKILALYILAKMSYKTKIYKKELKK